jgi:hypothetical protein
VIRRCAVYTCLQVYAPGAFLGPTELFEVFDSQSHLSIQLCHVGIIKSLSASVIIGPKRFIGMGMRIGMFLNGCIKFFWALRCESAWDPTN